jgi:hypothetical protein
MASLINQATELLGVSAAPAFIELKYARMVRNNRIGEHARNPSDGLPQSPI